VRDAVRLGLVCTGLALIGPVLLLRRRFVVVDVVGRSMEPTYHERDMVLVRRTATVTRDEVVVLQRPQGGGWAPGPPPSAVRSGEWMLKRVVAVPGDPMPKDVAQAAGFAHGVPVPAGTLVVLGDNALLSVDSRRWGPVPRDQVLGVVVRRLRGARPPQTARFSAAPAKLAAG
jgi:signal peptidase I